MKKWIFFILLIAVIVFAVVMYRRKKKKDDEAKKTDGGSGNTTSTTTNNSSTTTTKNSVVVQPDMSLDKANSATVKQLQTELNTAFSHWRTTGVPHVPSNLSVDGKIGTNTRLALQFVLGWVYNLGPATPKINLNQVVVKLDLLTLNTVRESIKFINTARTSQTY